MPDPALGEVRGVRLGDVYRDNEGCLWEVRALCTEPTVEVVGVSPLVSGNVETHVIGCRNWESRWKEGPLRAAPKGD